MSTYSLGQGCRTSARSKKPSTYARYIQQYQQQVLPKNARRSKPENEMSSDNYFSTGEGKKQRRDLLCVLSDGRRLNLEVIFNKNKPIAKNKPKNKPKTGLESKPESEKKPSNQESNLLSKFLFAFQQIEKDQQMEQQNNSPSPPLKNMGKLSSFGERSGTQAHSIVRIKESKEPKKREKDQDDKFVKYYEKLKRLDQKFLQIQDTFIQL